MPVRLWFSTLMLAVAGCSSAGWLVSPTPRPAAKPEPDRLILHADFPLRPEHRMIVELVNERELIGERLGIPPGKEPIHVYLFADEATYRARVEQELPGFPPRRAVFVGDDIQLSVYAHWGPHVAEDLRHETAHGYLNASVPNLPIWLDEGLAEYFEVGRGRRGLNRPHVEYLRGQHATAGWEPNMKRLEAIASAAEMTQRDYAEAWLWVHWMLESDAGPHDALQGLLVDLREDRSTTPLSARLPPAPAASEQLVAHLQAIKLEL